jgi:hypothetical protein
LKTPRLLLALGLSSIMAFVSYADDQNATPNESIAALLAAINDPKPFLNPRPAWAMEADSILMPHIENIKRIQQDKATVSALQSTLADAKMRHKTSQYDHRKISFLATAALQLLALAESPDALQELNRLRNDDDQTIANDADLQFQILSYRNPALLASMSENAAMPVSDTPWIIDEVVIASYAPAPSPSRSEGGRQQMEVTVWSGAKGFHQDPQYLNIYVSIKPSALTASHFNQAYVVDDEGSVSRVDTDRSLSLDRARKMLVFIAAGDSWPTSKKYTLHCGDYHEEFVTPRKVSQIGR